MVKIKLFVDKTIHENASYYYDQAKSTRGKIKRLEEEIKKTEEELKNVEETQEEKEFKRKKEWYEKFRFSYTREGKLIIAGRDAQQNDILVKKYMEDADLFFHADIQGGSATILKYGINAKTQEKEEAAQIAACFSKAWREGVATIDVYAAKKSQLSKNVSGEYVKTGGFIVSGEREWFKNTELKLKIGVYEGRIIILPSLNPTYLEKELLLIPSSSGKEKGKLAKSLAKRYGVKPDELLLLLPNGRTRTIMKS